ncbi:MAG: PIN domain-containing protein [Candidatus Brockarchaeota archaeon]|nr:PIN domain-containing protein [Candidatus Brockarchaeota archaeon]MBO3808434.1 PIN domain-containing protein [Candidatus Brockarchaeota archaeon]
MSLTVNSTANKAFVFDTYAIIEIIRGNANYEKYVGSSMIITKLTLFELVYYLLKNFKKPVVKRYLAAYGRFVQEFDEPVILESAVIKLKFKDRNLSMTDCVNYVLARFLGVKLLTGDEKFKDLENVEFIK